MGQRKAGSRGLYEDTLPQPKQELLGEAGVLSCPCGGLPRAPPENMPALGALQWPLRLLPCEVHAWTHVHCMEDNGADSHWRLGEGPRAPRAPCLVVWTPEDLLVGARFGLRSPSPWSFIAELFLGGASVSRVNINDASWCQGKTQGGRAPDGGVERQGASQLWNPTSPGESPAQPLCRRQLGFVTSVSTSVNREDTQATLPGGWKEHRVQPGHVPCLL